MGTRPRLFPTPTVFHLLIGRGPLITLHALVKHALAQLAGPRGPHVFLDEPRATCCIAFQYIAHRFLDRRIIAVACTSSADEKEQTSNRPCRPVHRRRRQSAKPTAARSRRARWSSIAPYAHHRCSTSLACRLLPSCGMDRRTEERVKNLHRQLRSAVKQLDHL